MEEKHPELAGVHAIWMKRWEEWHHPVYSLALVLNPEYHATNPWSDASVKRDVTAMLKRFFPVTKERAVAEALYTEYRKREGFFALTDAAGDKRAIWSNTGITVRSPWSWWEDVVEPDCLCGPFTNPAAELQVKVAKRFVWMARCVLRIAVAAAVNERVFSNWKHILGSARAAMGKKRQLQAVNIYTDERVMKKVKTQHHANLDFGDSSSKDEGKS